MGVAWLVASALCVVGCAPVDLCEERTTWASRDTAACVACERECRVNASAMPPMGCDEEFACVARCPDRSSLTCGCVQSCLRTDRCRQTWSEVLRCYSDNCRGKCR
ncbi:MAG: hypothetical protein JNK05_22120 [Myxococcales bacterium]|nr:hypothetical protein [Myxococcales bacterium]